MCKQSRFVLMRPSCQSRIYFLCLFFVATMICFLLCLASMYQLGSFFNCSPCTGMAHWPFPLRFSFLRCPRLCWFCSASPVQAAQPSPAQAAQLKELKARALGNQGDMGLGPEKPERSWAPETEGEPQCPRVPRPQGPWASGRTCPKI